MIKFRAATVADIPELKAFEHGVVEAERPLAPNLVDGKISYYDLHALIESDQSLLIVAELDGQLLASGYGSIKQDKPYFHPPEFIYLGFMYVVESHRGQGINQQLIKVILDWGRARGITALKLDVYSQNEAAIRAYEKIGFRANLLEMWMGD